MNEQQNVLFDIHIIGSDYTPLDKCLKDCYIQTEFRENNPMFCLIKDCLYVDNVGRSRHFLEVKDVNKRRKEKLNNIILRRFKDREQEIREDIVKEEKQIGKDRNRLNYLSKLKKKTSEKEQEKIELKKAIEESESSNKRKEKKIEVLNKITELIYINEKGNIECPSEEELNNMFPEDYIDKNAFSIYKEWYELLNRMEDISNESPLIRMYKKFAENFSFTDNEKLIVGRRADRSHELSESDCKLYAFYNNEHQFGNLVGTVRKTYSCKEFADFFKDCLDFKDSKRLFDELSKEQYEGKKIALTIQIHSRLDNNPDKPFFLLELLTQGNLRFFDSEVLSNDKDEAIFNCLLLWRLKQHLLQAYQKGAFRTYHTFHENGIRLRGAIDFTEHIKRNMGLKNGKIAYSYREKSVDNYLNHIILESYNHLKNKYFDLVLHNIDTHFEVKEIINLLQQETRFPHYSRNTLIKKCEVPITHPYYTEYEDLRKVCLSILRDEGASLISGSGGNTSGILYYIPDLWEEYLENKMNNIRFTSQNNISVFCGIKKGDNEEDYQNVFRPDLVLKDEKDVPYMVLDAKYKPGWNVTHCYGKFDIRTKKDYEECIRNMNALNTYATGVLFPVNELLIEEEDKSDRFDKIIMHSISKYNGITSFYTIPICIPPIGPSEKFVAWQQRMSDSINGQTNMIFDIAEEEKSKYTMINNVIKSVDLANYRNNHCLVMTVD